MAKFGQTGSGESLTDLLIAYVGPVVRDEHGWHVSLADLVDYAGLYMRRVFTLALALFAANLLFKDLGWHILMALAFGASCVFGGLGGLYFGVFFDQKRW